MLEKRVPLGVNGSMSTLRRDQRSLSRKWYLSEDLKDEKGPPAVGSVLEEYIPRGEHLQM